MEKLRIIAPLDEKNISPTTIIDDLTNCNNIGGGCTAVGYIYKTPVLFEYSGNLMRIRFKDKHDLEMNLMYLRNYCKDMVTNTEGLELHGTEFGKSYEIRFFWQI